MTYSSSAMKQCYATCIVTPMGPLKRFLPQFLIKAAALLPPMNGTDVCAGTLQQCSPTLGLQMFLDYNSQKPSPPPLLARISGSWKSKNIWRPKVEDHCSTTPMWLSNLGNGTPTPGNNTLTTLCDVTFCQQHRL